MYWLIIESRTWYGDEMAHVRMYVRRIDWGADPPFTLNQDGDLVRNQ